MWHQCLYLPMKFWVIFRNVITQSLVSPSSITPSFYIFGYTKPIPSCWYRSGYLSKFCTVACDCLDHFSSKTLILCHFRFLQILVYLRSECCHEYPYHREHYDHLDEGEARFLKKVHCNDFYRDIGVL